MKLPFSHDAFLDVFGRYNTVLWPAVVLLWLATVALAWEWVRRDRIDGRKLFALLSVHWAWSGIAYHWFFFRNINPAASVFAALFVLQAILFAWLAVRSRAQFAVELRPRRMLSGALVCYGLAYPFLSLAFGLHYPRLPLFAVPCPTTLVTAGFLLTATSVPRFIKVVPVVWAIIGSSAAIFLGIRADVALVAAGALLGLDILLPTALGSTSV